jgi:hypothetical protein
MATKRRSRFEVTADVVADTSQFQRAVTDLSKGLSGLTRSLFRDTQKNVSEGIRLGLIKGVGDAKIGQQLNNIVKNGVIGLGKEIQKALEREDYRRAEALQYRLRVQNSATQHELSLRKKAAEDLEHFQKKAASERTQLLMRSFEQGLSRMGGSLMRGNALSSAQDLLGVARKAGGSLQTRGRAGQHRAQEFAAQAEKARSQLTRRAERLEAYANTPGARRPQDALKRAAAARSEAGKAGQAAKGAQALAKVASTLSKLGAAVGVIAAIAGIVLVLVKLFMDLEKRVKDMNKELTKGLGAANMGLSEADIRGGKLAEQLEEIRKQTTAVNANFGKFRATAKEQNEILNQFAQAGYDLGKMNAEFARGSKLIKNYSDVTAIALTYSRNLGVESQEIAQSMGNLTFVTGNNLEDVAEGFSNIQREAAVSGLMTKRFYAAIVEATSGMAFYGVRIEETTQLLSTFDSLLGQAAGEEAFKKVAGRGEKSYQDSLKEFIIKDESFVQETYADIYKTRLAHYKRDQSFEGVDIDKLLESGSAEELSTAMQMQGITGQRAGDISKLYKLKQAAGGNRAAMMAARGSAGPAFEAAMALRTLPSLGGESISEVHDMALKSGNEALLIALQNLSEMTGKSFEEMQSLDETLQGQFNALKKYAETGEALPEHLQKMGFYIENAGTENAKIMRGVATVLDDGEIAIEGGEIIADKFDILTKAPMQSEKSLENQMTKDQELAAAISENITGLTELMDQTTNAILERIYDAVMFIVELFGKDDEQARKEASLRAAHDLEKKTQEEEKKTREDLAKAKSQLSRAEAGGDQEQIKKAKAEVDRLVSETQEKEFKVMQAQVVSQAQRSKSAEAREGMGMGADVGVEALQAAGFDVLTGPGETKAYKSMLEQALYRTNTEFTMNPLGGDDFLGKGGFLESMSEDTMREWGALFKSIEGLEEDTRKNLMDVGVGKIVREGAIDEAIVEGRKQYDAAKASGMDDRAAFEAFNVGVESTLTSNLLTKDERQRQHKETVDAIESIEKMLGNPTGILGVAALAAMGTVKKANDFILPSSGAPIIPHSEDTIIGMKPGGPLAAMMGGGGGNYYEININGNDATAMYNTLMEVLNRVDD